MLTRFFFANKIIGFLSQGAEVYGARLAERRVAASEPTCWHSVAKLLSLVGQQLVLVLRPSSAQITPHHDEEVVPSGDLLSHPVLVWKANDACQPLLAQPFVLCDSWTVMWSKKTHVSCAEPAWWWPTAHGHVMCLLERPPTPVAKREGWIKPSAFSSLSHDRAATSSIPSQSL